MTAETVCDLVMLVDDSSIDNFVNQKMIERYGLASNVLVFSRARKALEHLRSISEESALLPGTVPSIIFLDLNMPMMNGFDFLREYRSLGSHITDNCKVVVLSSTINPADMQLAMRHQEVSAFFTKPLIKNSLDKIAKALKEDTVMA